MLPHFSLVFLQVFESFLGYVDCVVCEVLHVGTVLWV